MMRFPGSVVVFWSCSALAGCGGVAHSLGGDAQHEGSSGGDTGVGGEGTGATGGENWGASAVGGETAVGGAGGQDYGGAVEGAGGARGCGAYYGAGAEPSYCQASGGSVGAAGSPSCDPAACPMVSPPDQTINIPGCCLTDGSCGVDGSLASVDGVPIDPGCHAYNEVGVDTNQCPTTFPVQGASPLPGCCTPSGICGVDMGLLNLGCVPRATRDPSGVANVPPIYCQYPRPIQATGGAVGYGGSGGYYYGYGGAVSYGGYGAAGGYGAVGGAGGDPTGIGGAGGEPMLQTGGSAPTPAAGGSAF